MALTLVQSRTFNFSVLGDGVNTILVVDLAEPPFQATNRILRVVEVVVSGAGVLDTHTFTGSTVTITFLLPFVGVADVSLVVLI